MAGDPVQSRGTWSFDARLAGRGRGCGRRCRRCAGCYATVYARWAGKALPTSRQWEKAARSPKGRDYPWGNEPTAAKCNAAETGIDATTPVSRYELKGSAWTSPFERAAPSPQNAADSTMKDNDIGFRCISSSDVFCAAPPPPSSRGGVPQSSNAGSTPGSFRPKTAAHPHLTGRRRR
ncbi:SUMF1/EgtB/PvdO family nonheme iron enzyme [Streptomyces sp. NPDC056669]|uniref:SUMF1/EgtB/PvdO family nonheme iron enzyme n=1 Tax=Streptomyces sp. NPDC056669 TaxID=3345903 RepID=UPI0036BC19B6